MKIIIAGLGFAGRALTNALVADGHKITVIDKNEKITAEIEDECRVSAVTGDISMPDTVMTAGAGECDLYIACCPYDEQSILSCLAARRAGAKNTAVILRTAKYINDIEYWRRLCDIDFMINPEYETALGLFRSVRIPAASGVASFANGKAFIAKFVLPENCQLSGKTLAEIRSSTKLSVLFCAVTRNSNVYIPDGAFQVKTGDTIYVTGPYPDLSAFMKVMGMPSDKIKNAYVTGNGDFTKMLLSMLKKGGINTDCDFDKADAVMAMSDDDRDNVIMSMYAKAHNSKKIITRMSGKLSDILPDLGFNSSVLSVEKTLIDMALAYVRALTQSKSSSVGTILRIADGGAEIVEFIAKAGFKGIGVPLMRLDIKKDVLIAGIVRSKELLFAGGASSIFEDDRVIVVNAGSPLRSLDEILK